LKLLIEEYKLDDESIQAINWFVNKLYDKYGLKEDSIGRKDKIKPYNQYDDGNDTRMVMASELENMLLELNNYKFVNNVRVTASDKRGLSIYPQVRFNLPTECTNRSLNKFKVRVSDHPFRIYRGWQDNIESVDKTLEEIKEQIVEDIKHHIEEIYNNANIEFDRNDENSYLK